MQLIFFRLLCYQLSYTQMHEIQLTLKKKLRCKRDNHYTNANLQMSFEDLKGFILFLLKLRYYVTNAACE